MNDLHSRLDRLAGRVDDRPAPDVHAARERHQRRRTRSAMAVGLVVAVAAGALVVSALPSSDQDLQNPTPTVAAWTPPDPITLWPESPITAETPEEAQARVDAGEDQWRLDPEQVVTRFGEQVLGWSDIVLSEPRQEGSLRYYEILCAEICEHGLRVGLVQPLGSGVTDIWSVASIWHPNLVIDAGQSEPGSALAAGSLMSFDVSLPSGRTAHAGAVAGNDCAQTGATAIALESGTATITLPYASGDDPNCSDVGAGYAYVYAMDDTTVPSGSDPITQPAAIEYPYLTVVPIYLQMESGEVAQEPVVADVLNVTCDGQGTRIDATSIQASPGGVGIYTQPYNQRVDLLFDGDREEILIVDYAAATIDLPPGQHTISCLYDGDIGLGSEAFEVVDPEGYWTDPSVDCAPPWDEADIDTGAIPVEGDPNDELLAAGDAILTSKIGQGGPVALGGYPEARGSRIVLRLDEEGSVVGRLNFYLSGQDWFTDSYVTCEGQTIT